MIFGILGTGMVGKAHAARLIELGHEVYMGTQSPNQKLKNEQSDNNGKKFSDWIETNKSIKLVDFSVAANEGEVIINALSGQASLEVLKNLEMQIDNKILIDIANPLDFSQGMPPTLTICNNTSLGEQIQTALPNARVVKSFNTTNADIQVKPQELASGDHHMFISGNDEDAKQEVLKLLESYGWQNIIDLGDITTARGTEMFLPLWVRIFSKLGHSKFNLKIVDEK